MLGIENKIYCGDNVESLTENDEYKIMRLKDKNGEGIMTIYNVMPGIFLMYNDFRAKRCISKFKTHANLLCIDHCKEGCLEHDMGNGIYKYLHTGDLRIDNRVNHSGKNVFPLNHYHGISIILEVDLAQTEIDRCFNGFNINLSNLKSKYCKKSNSYIIHRRKEITNMFYGLYWVPKKIRLNYCKIKVLEILLFLDALELPQHKKNETYFYKSQVEKIKSIQSLLVSDLTKNYTINDISKKYEISTTSLKKCFKEVYREPIFTYTRNYKMNYAAILLKTKKKLKVIEIASMIGYTNPSKFAAAFKSVMGKTPIEYKKIWSSIKK